ncbi:MAG: DUF421 domain-containing protein [Clostridia bacterium]|nr:DUF421 domain-containing protein [Clostridia bacterium]
MEFLKITLTALLSAGALFVITKCMGHKQVAQLDFFDYISGITIGSIAAELATDLESPWKSLTALVIYGIVSVVLGLLTAKFPRSRKFINGTPTILMDNGKIIRGNLKKAKLDLSEFLLLCREQGYFDLEEIQTAVFEHNGKLSVLPKAEKRPATPYDLNLMVSPAHIGTEVIMDGRIMGENLARAGRDEKWLEKQMKSQGYRNAGEIFLGIYRQDEDALVLYPAEKHRS